VEVLKVEGMSCSHCEKAIQNALEDIGVVAIASAKDKTVSFEAGGVAIDTIKDEITKTGYVIK